jgi:hypothetical protein
MIDDDNLKQLLRNDARFQLCKSLTDKRDLEASSSFEAVESSLTDVC